MATTPSQRRGLPADPDREVVDQPQPPAVRASIFFLEGDCRKASRSARAYQRRQRCARGHVSPIEAALDGHLAPRGHLACRPGSGLYGCALSRVDPPHNDRLLRGGRGCNQQRRVAWVFANLARVDTNAQHDTPATCRDYWGDVATTSRRFGERGSHVNKECIGLRSLSRAPAQSSPRPQLGPREVSSACRGL